MRIECIHGYFKFFETEPGQLSRFASRFGFELERSGDHYTFADLVDADEYSIKGGLYLGAPSLFTFAGRPWDVMRENRLSYNFALELMMPFDLILQPISLTEAGHYWTSNGLILAGSVNMKTGDRVTDYVAHYLFDRDIFRYSGIEYE